ncbi:MAG: hypothetical protein J5993_06600 [Clostridia bacterium]|nr:hypothetical protein [Clostridia bacterium]
MEEYEIRDVDFTEAAWESLYDVVDDTQFLNKDAQLIYNSLKHCLKIRSFGDYLKRYIYLKAGLSEPFDEVPLKEYQLIIRSSFSDNLTPPSFFETTAKLSALSKNWLTQQTVKRNVVFLLGFGLNMSVDDVNMFLTKALCEQEINPKNPFEVVCWYCYHKQYNFLKFEQLWKIYNETSHNSLDMGRIYSEQTIGVRNSMQTIHDDATLIAHLAKLKANEKMSAMSLTAKQCFNELYDEARDLIAKIYNTYEAEEFENTVREYIHKLSNNDHLYDYEKKKRIEQFRSKKKVFVREDITESDIEHIICAAIPTDRHGNLTPSKASKLNGQFAGKRFSRQRIGDILSGNAEVTRFDLITLNFFVFSQKLDEYPDSKVRYVKFHKSMNAILEKCFLGKLYIQNPYECFVLMCILSEEPLGTYADVWELSYHS